MDTSPAAPAAFLGHGNPMNALETNRYSATWQALGRSVPRPRAILMVSAHWYINATAVTAMAQPRTIHDFYGFPQALFDVQYPAPGLPELVDEIAEAVRPEAVGADHDSWGLDHGSWSVLRHVYPDADVPVVQLSINALKPANYHVEMGARLAALGKRGVMIMGSGNVVHNLRAMARDRPDAAFDWAQRFDEAARDLMTTHPFEVARLMEHPDYQMAAPTTEHFVPLLHVAGFAAAAGVVPTVLVEGYAHGSLSMISYGVGVPRLPATDDRRGAAPLGSTLPAEASNV
jgi:4,5-DOPA dioxygenase extradiol